MNSLCPIFFCIDKRDMQGGTKNLCVWHVKSQCDPAPILGLFFHAIKTEQTSIHLQTLSSYKRRWVQLCLREDLQDETASLNTRQCKTLTFPTGKTLSQMPSAVKINGTLCLLISLRHLHTYCGFLARHLADGETEAQDGTSTCVKSCSESVTDPEPERRNLCIPVPFSDHISMSCTRRVIHYQ